MALINLDWWTDKLLMPVLVGIVVTISSPIVRSLIVGSYRRMVMALGFVTLKTLRSRIRQAELDHKAVLELRSDYAKTSGLIMSSLMPLFLCTSIIVLPLFYSCATKTDLPQWLISALAGIVGVGFRWFLEAVSAFNLVVKAANFTQYEKDFLQQQQQLNELREGLERGLE